MHTGGSGLEMFASPTILQQLSQSRFLDSCVGGITSIYSLSGAFVKSILLTKILDPKVQDGDIGLRIFSIGFTSNSQAKIGSEFPLTI